jgi:hypothetical protein
MSWRAYEILTLSPDFNSPPRQGFVDDREINDTGGAERFTAWPDRTDRTFSLTFQTMDRTEWLLLREFFDRHSGRARAFYLPSWSADFQLEFDAPQFANTIYLAGNSLSGITENRPDTIGRRLMLYNQAGQLSTHWVTSASNQGNGSDLVVLDPPLAAAASAGKTVISICYLVRLVDDTIQSTHQSPDHARIELAFRELSHRRRLDQTESAIGPEIANLNANEDLIASDEDPLYPNTLQQEFFGPFVYGIPQSNAYASSWQARYFPSLNIFTVTNPSGSISNSTLFNGANVNQIAATFDATGKEIIAWEQNRQTTIAYFVGSTPTRLTIDGISPVAFNTYAIDSLVNAGTATVAIFYLREQDATIYCRTSAESWAVEHRYCKSPVAPLALHTARREEGRIELVGMDTNHRLVRWRSYGYLTPPELQSATSFIHPITGSSVAITVPIFSTAQATSVIGPMITGQFAEIRVPAAAFDTMGRSFVTSSITGTFEEIRVPAFAKDEVVASVVANSLNGSYTLIAIMTGFTPPEKATSSIRPTITGSYS